jgi:hypothetical protein
LQRRKLRCRKKLLRYCVEPVDNSEGREKLIVNLSPAARALADSIREDTGIPKAEAVGRILEWFMSLDRKFRTAVLVRDEDAKREYTRLVLQEMAGLTPGDLPAAAEELDVEKAAAVAHSMIMRMLTAHRAELSLGKLEKNDKRKK